MDVVDLRSDTVTVPDAGMRAAIASAAVGDDVMGEDPTVRRLEEVVAGRLGKEAAVFVPTGTMGNLVCVAAQTSPGDEVIADTQSHIVLSEVAGAAVVAGVQLRTMEFHSAVPDPGLVEAALRDDNIHFPRSRLLCVENTHNRRGGAALSGEQVGAAATMAHRSGLRVHCDGARLFNAAVALDVDPATLVDAADSVSVCFSKGLGAPVGSAVAGDAAFVAEARRWRKRLGGGMRQAGVIAAAALYALEHNVDRLAQDHDNARAMVEALRESGIELHTAAVPTNMLFVETDRPAGSVAAELAELGVLVGVVGAHELRCVTHLGVDAGACRRASGEMARVLAGAAAATPA